MSGTQLMWSVHESAGRRPGSSACNLLCIRILPSTAYSGQGQMDSNPQKRQSTGDGGPPPKKFKGAPELPGDYSDAVRKKYQSASRTGQACDRCKVRRDRTCQEPGRRSFTPISLQWAREMI